MENGGSIHIDVYNVAGLEMRHLVAQSMIAGAYTIYWDGRDDTGAPMASGLYLVVMTEPSRMEIKKVVVLKQ